jgi:hypothetical protein
VVGCDTYRESAANIAQSWRRRGKAHLDGEHIIRFRHSFLRPLDDHAGVTLKACRPLQGVHMASDLGDGIEHADGHGRVWSSALPDLVEGGINDAGKSGPRRYRPQLPVIVESIGGWHVALGQPAQGRFEPIHAGDRRERVVDTR